MLPSPGAAQAKDADLALKGAIAARMSKDPSMVAAASRAYAPIFAGNPNKASFDVITAQTDLAGAALSEAVKRLADAPTIDAFSAAMKKRFEASKTAPAPAAAAPVPAKPAAPAPAKPAAPAGQTAAAAAAPASGGSK